MQINWNRCLSLFSILVCCVAIAACSQPTDLSLPQYTPSVNVVPQAWNSPLNYRVLYNFGATPDGNGPRGRLVAVNGKLYGATSAGGKYCPHIAGCGTAFSVTTGGIEKVLHSFGGPGGSDPSPLIDVNGALYGTTFGGGKYEGGTVFSVTTDGAEKVLHSFGNETDGDAPYDSLIEVNGVLYGTTEFGGKYGAGTVFSITTDGTEKLLHSFGKGTDGSIPEFGLIEAQGTLYGTTYLGGTFADGTVFSISTADAEKVLHSFSGSRTDGNGPAGFLADVHGTLYGTTAFGGKYGKDGSGTVFSITTGGTEKVLHNFGRGTDGSQPRAGLIDVKGTLYGTTSGGGASYAGTVFRITTSGTEKTLHSFSNEGRSIGPTALSYENGKLVGTTVYGGTYGYGTVFSLEP
jgi:uncharacterized repeat protein (TIGR03803 family)